MSWKKGSKKIDISYSDQQDKEDQRFSTINLGSYRRNNQSPASNKKAKNVSQQLGKQWKGWFYLIAAVVVVGIAIYYFSFKCGGQQSKLKQLKAQIDQKEGIIAKLRKQQLDDIQKISKLTQTSQDLINKIQQLKNPNKEAPKPNQQATPTVGQSPNVVIDVKYDQTEYGPLPINPLRKNAKNQGVADAIYKDDQMRKKREQFIQQRINFINSKTAFPSLFLAKYNFISTEQMLKEAIAQNQKEWLRLQTKFKLSSLKQELPICVVVPGYNNNANFRIEGDLNSVFTQNYTNYKVVIVDDASTDGSGELYQKFFNFYSIDKSRYFFVQNTKRATALQNIFQVSINQCSKDSIVITMDGDDEFIGRNVLQVFNWAYQTKKAGVVYSNFYWYQQPQTLMYGFTSQYTQNERKNNLYRGSPQRFSQLRSYRAQLVHQINPKDLQDDKGVFYTIAYDMALFFPLMELSCGRVGKIEGQFHYLYNIGTGINDYQDRGRQVAVDNKVRAQKKYQCYKPFDERMSK